MTFPPVYQHVHKERALYLTTSLYFPHLLNYSFLLYVRICVCVWFLPTNKESAILKHPLLTPFSTGLKSLDNGFAVHGCFDSVASRENNWARLL